MKIKAKEKMMEAKEFVIEHKEGLAIAGSVVLAGVVGYKIGRKNWFCDWNDPVFKQMAIDIMNMDKIDIYNGIENVGLKPSELGKLGESIVEFGGDESNVFTHFIAIGESK